MGLTGIVGGMRKGKTLLMIILGHANYVKQRKVYANLYLNYPKVKKAPRTRRFSLFDLVQFMDKDSEWRNLFLGWDEIYLNLECRISASSELNRVASYFLFQSGKRDISIAWTSQRFGNPDNRLRWATLEVGTLIKAVGVFVECPFLGYRIDATHCWRTNCKGLPSCREYNNFVLKFKILKGDKWRTYTLDRVQRFYDMYRTEEIISYRETLKVNAYLRARKSQLRKDYRLHFSRQKDLTDSTESDLKKLAKLID